MADTAVPALSTLTLGDTAATFRTLAGAENCARRSFADVEGVSLVVLRQLYPTPAYAVVWAYAVQAWPPATGAFPGPPRSRSGPAGPGLLLTCGHWRRAEDVVRPRLWPGVLARCSECGSDVVVQVVAVSEVALDAARAGRHP